MNTIVDVQKLGVILILAAACGCSGSTPKYAANSPAVPSSSPSAETPAADTRPVIVCFGDSLTAGYGVDRDRSYPADLQRDLDAEGFHYRVVNMGVSGDTTKDGLARLPRVIAAKPEIVVVEFGGNDGLRGLPLSDTQKNLDTIVSTLKKSVPHVVMAGISLPPNYGAAYVTQFNAMYPTIAKKNAVALLPFIYKDVYDKPGFIQDDGVHATVPGNVQVAKNIQGLIKPLLKK